MRTVTGNTAPGAQNAMDFKFLLYPARHVFLLIFMANDTEFRLPGGPQSKLAFRAVLIMTDGASTGADRAMDMPHGPPFIIVNVTTKTDLLNLAGGNRHFALSKLRPLTGTAG